MAQFEVYRTRFPGAPLVVDIQANLVSHLETRVVIPLEPQVTAKQLERLHPTVDIYGQRYVLNTASFRTSLSPNSGAHAVASRTMDAVDFLPTGF